VLSRLLDDRAERLADKPAVDTVEGKVTYGELRDRVQRLARGLVDLGVAAGDCVATMLDSNLDYVLSWFGIAWAGGVEVPVNTELRGVFLEHVLAESGASVLVVAGRWVERLADLEVPTLRHIVVVGDAAKVTAALPVHPLDALLAANPLPRVARDENDLTYVLYTSGTTGPSKGVMHSGRSALWTAQVWMDMMRLGGDDVGYSMLPLFHVTARSATMTANFMAGGSVALRDRFSVSRFWDDVRATGSTNFMYMGAIVHLLAAQPPTERDADHRARIAGGAAALPHLVAQFRERFGVDLIEVFGMTEIGTVTGPEHGRARPGVMGKPFPHVEIEIHDESDASVPAETPGEIVVRPRVSGAIFSGYWRNPQATVDAWRNLWFHTGDRGRLTEDGDLVYLDRIKDSLRRRGENISSFEVERGVQAHPDVLECAAYAVPSEFTEDEVMIAVVAREGVQVDHRALFEHCVAVLPRFAVPRYIRIVDALPKTPTNRVQKHVLRSEGVVADAADLAALGIVVPRS
jgi:crotonobetaine/carnitine-CoA ligase